MPALRPDLAWHHDKSCKCQKPDGDAACGSCPFTVAAHGQKRPSNKALGLAPAASDSVPVQLPQTNEQLGLFT